MYRKEENYLPDSDGQLTVLNTNWSDKVSLELHKLICCPAFHANLGLLHYAIKEAVYHRNNRTTNTPVLSDIQINHVVQHIQDKGLLVAGAEDALKVIISSHFPPKNVPEHFEFTYLIRRVVEQNHRGKDRDVGLKPVDLR